LSKTTDWPKGPVRWYRDGVEYISIAFTWHLPMVRDDLNQALFPTRTIVGGPAVRLMPGFFDGVLGCEVGKEDVDGVLQMANPMATRTTLGCPRKCKFCAVGSGQIETKGFVELDDWPDNPMVCDNNLLAASVKHFDRVIDRLVAHGWADFNQGLDARLMTAHHARQMAKIKTPVVRLALDHQGMAKSWARAYDLLRVAGINKRNIRSYALIGFDSGVEEAWDRCFWIESHGVRSLPMWFNRLDTLVQNEVTDKQRKLGWDEDERVRIMKYFYHHRDISTKRRKRNGQPWTKVKFPKSKAVLEDLPESEQPWLI